jgi:hypothetical protein
VSTEVEIIESAVVLRRKIRGQVMPTEVFSLTFAEVKAMAETLREHLQANMPPEVPETK